MKLLLTGGCGFIGSNFVGFVQRYYPSWLIINLDALTYCGNKDNLPHLHSAGELPEHENFRQRYRFVHGDVCDFELVCKLITIALALIPASPTVQIILARINFQRNCCRGL